MPTRENALKEWLEQHFKLIPFTLTPLTGDASFRRYFRLTIENASFIIMDAPPTHESMPSFIDVGLRLTNANILHPTVHAVDLIQGFAILDDFGDTLFLSALTPTNSDRLYLEAINTLVQIQTCSTVLLPECDKAHLLNEMDLFEKWFLNAYLGVSLTSHQKQELKGCFDFLAKQLLAQPQVFIHRDYHSRNLMIMGEPAHPSIGVIDFQDAMRGPITYDLVSLLKDCYHTLSTKAYRDYASAFYHAQPIAQTVSFSEFLDALDFCGLQRHLKVLGIFCRLYLRDNKPNYLNDLPRTLSYTLAAVQRHDALAPLSRLITEHVLPSFMEKSSA